jgi:hypothetical protein
MQLIALMPARNEAWIIGLSLRVAMRWCDSVVVLDHASTDGTAGLLDALKREFKSRLTVLREEDPAWSEMAHRQRLLDAGRAAGGTHFALVDADEVLTGNLLPGIRGMVSELGPGGYLQVGMQAMWRSLGAVRTDGRTWAGREDLVLAFADRVRIGWQSGGYDHHHRHPHGSVPHRGLRNEHGGVMHLQWASWRRLVAKHARYKMMERLKYPEKNVREIDRMYSQALDERGLSIRPTPVEWWAPYKELMGYVDLSVEPWQETECKRLWVEHGSEAFRGLDLFGVCQ